MWIARCLVLLLACQPAPVVGPETEPITAQEMPAFPPDSLPSASYNDSSYVVEDPTCRRSPFMRSIVTVTFVEGMTHAERQEAVVPPVAPDTVPEGFYDEENFRMGSACITGRMLRGIVVVMFEGGTTQPQKQEAIDLVDGEVVGGIRSRDDIEGYYYVQVEEDPEGRILCDAIETLNALPQVANATESLTVSGFYRRPDEHPRQSF